MRVRFGFDFDEAGRASGFNVSGHSDLSALSVPLNPINGLVTESVVSGAGFSAFGVSDLSSAAGLSSRAFGGVSDGAVVLTIPVGESDAFSGGIAGSNSPEGSGHTVAGGPARTGVSHNTGDGINESSGPGLTARISQYYDAGQARYEFSGNQDIDAALIGSKWTITNLTYSFPTSGSFYQTPYYNSTYLSHQIAFNAAQQNAVRYALGLIYSYTLLTFTEVTESNTTHGNLRFSQTSSGITSAEGNFPGSDTWDGDIWFNSGAVNPQPFYQTPNIGNWGQATIMHEIGHTMGLKHGHQDYTNVDLTNGGYIDGPGPRYGSAALPSNHDGQAWSLMTYRSDPSNTTVFEGDQFNQPQTYMQNDIAALQYLYGAWFGYNSGNTTYTFSATTGEMFVNGVSQGDPDGNKVFRTIWDGNGIDTYDLSNFTGNQSIDLRAGNWTTFNTAQLANSQARTGGNAPAPGNIANALLYQGDLRSLIENAIGGTGNDTIYGNQVANTLTGGGGNDYLYGIAGNDTNYGGAGNDTLDESLGTDGGNDNQYGEAGDDDVYGGYGNDYVDGGTGNDYVVGNDGNDVLYGGTGTDTLVGGTGDDTMYVDNVGDVVTEAASAGADWIYSTISYTLGANQENLYLYSGTTNGTGNSLANIVWGSAGANIIDMRSGGNDTVYAGLGNDVVYSSGFGAFYGEGGNDTIYIANGFPEILDGGGNTDLLEASSAGFDYVINMVTGVTNFATESFVNFENLNSGSGNDYITGTAGNNIINTGLGNDTVYGNGYSGGDGDIVDGGDGNDELHSSGRGTYIAGNGNDTVYAGVGLPETLDGGAGVDWLDTTTWGFSYTINLITGVTNYDTESFINFENLRTGNGNDSLTGTDDANIIYGGTGNDTIRGGDGVDSLYGEDGDDLIDGGFQYDAVLDGGNGSDTIDYSWIGDTFDSIHIVVNLGLGTWTSDLGLTENFTSIENVLGSQSSETIIGSGAVNRLYGNDGNDTLDGAGGYNDYLDGGNGVDTVDYSWISSGFDSANITINLALGTYTDTFGTETLVSIENLLGTQSADHIIGSDAVNRLYGNDGDDVLDGGNGYDDYLDGGAGSDTVDYSWIAAGFDSSNIVIDLTLGSYVDVAGTETLVSIENILGTQSSETIIGTDGANRIEGNDGNDNITGGAGDDTLTGGLGDDTINAGALSDGTDTVHGGAGNDLITSSGQGTYTGGAGNDTVWAGLTGSVDEDLDGGDDIDTLNTTLFDGDYAVNLATGVTNYSPETFINFENLIGGAGNDTYVGTDGNNSIDGGAGNDDIDSGLGEDTLNGGDGDDLLHSSSGGTKTYTGGAGNDTVDGIFNYNSVLDGGAGVDLLTLVWVGVSTEPITIDLVAGTYTDAFGSFTMTNFENYNGFNSNETIIGTAAANAINGGAGNDSISGAAGNDWLDGGVGADSLAGGSGNDTFIVDDIGDLVAEAGGAGTDLVNSSVTYTLTGNVEDLALTGGGNINGTGNTSANRIMGTTGNNAINGRAGADSMTGLEGDDSYYVDDAGDRVYEANVTGVDTVFSTVSFTGAGQYIENITLTGVAATNATGNGLANYLTGNTAANSLNGSGGADTMAGGAGNDTYTVENAGDVIVEANGAGADVVNASVSYTLGAGVYVEVFNLTGGNSISATGNNLVNTINGNTGNNLIDGGAGADILSGGLGNDTYILDNPGDQVFENVGEGTDWVQSYLSRVLAANVENLQLLGASGLTGTGNADGNRIIGNTGNNKLLGLDGNDDLDGGAGNDTLTGGLGDDSYIVDAIGDVIVENVGEGTEHVRASLSWTLGANLENLLLLDTGGNINATGNTLDNRLWGNIGDNVLDGGLGADSLSGGTGNDTYVVDNAGDTIAEINSGGVDVVNASVSYTLGAGVYVETFNLTGAGNISAFGNANNNILNGNSGNNTLNGAVGADSMTGGLGDDTYFVDNTGDRFFELIGEGNDWVFSTVSVGVSGQYVENIELQGVGNINANGQGLDNMILGNSGANTLNGSSGNDTLSGRGGNDILIGGTGADKFIFIAGSGLDTINDFNAAQNDLININDYTHGVVNDPSVTITQVGGDVTIDLGGGNIITVIGATAAAPAFQSHIVW